MSTPLPGDFALTRISGFTGRAIAAGQWLIGDGSPVQHAMIYVGGGYVVQAMPGGAEMIRLEDANEPVIWSTDIGASTPAQRRVWGMSPDKRRAVVREALALVDTPYSFVDYASIGLAAWHIRPAWVRNFVASTSHMICSQLVDEAYKRAGVQLFDDGRLPGDVTPGDLWHLLQRPCEARAQSLSMVLPVAA